MNGTMNTKAYIVDEISFKIKRDEVDLAHCIKMDIPLTATDIANHVEKKAGWFVRGAKTNLNPEGKIYLAENCFKTKEAAKEKLKDIILKTLDKNLILIENLQKENHKLYKIMEGLKHD